MFIFLQHEGFPLVRAYYAFAIRRKKMCFPESDLAYLGIKPYYQKVTGPFKLQLALHFHHSSTD